MVRLIATGYLPPPADASGPFGFRIGNHVLHYRPPFRERPRLTLRISRDLDTDELYVRWEATGMPAGSVGDDRRGEVTQSDAFPFAWTGLPAPGP